MAFDQRDTVYMERAMALAREGLGRTSPNPLVGAVIVRDNRVIGEGYHAGPWHDHAEVDAIKDALRRSGDQSESGAAGVPPALGPNGIFAGTTMYVTLEPCCTYGRTPPCTSALVAGGFERVVVGVVDPSPDVNGRGLQTLRDAGIRVDLAEGELVRRLKRQNNGARKSVLTGLPFVTYKYAMTLDGRVATDSGDSRWISGPESRELVHRWRAWSDAVMVGAGTLRRDDPRLTARAEGTERQPLRVVVDPELSITEGAAVVRTVAEGPVLVICSPQVGAERRGQVESWGVETAVAAREPSSGAVASGAVAPRRTAPGAVASTAVASKERSGEGAGWLEAKAVARLLAARGAQTILLEGGPRLAGSLWAAGLIDKVAAFVCPHVVSGRENRAPLIGSGSEAVADSTRLGEIEVERIGSDVLITGYTGEPF